MGLEVFKTFGGSAGGWQCAQASLLRPRVLIRSVAQGGQSRGGGWGRGAGSCSCADTLTSEARRTVDGHSLPRAKAKGLGGVRSLM